MLPFSMVLLLEEFTKLFSMLDNRQLHHVHPLPEKLSSSLPDFQSHVSKLIDQLALDLKLGSEIMSLSWIEKCFGLLPIINKGFSKLVVDIEYPMSKWKTDSTDGYLNYTLSMLDLLNSITSSISHLCHARISLAYGLTLMEDSPSLATMYLKAIQPGCFRINFGKQFHTDEDKAITFTCKGGVVHEAMKEMKTIGFWVCGVLLSGLYSDAKPYMELRKFVSGFDGSSVMALDSIISEHIVEKIPIFREVKEINYVVVDLLVASAEVRRDLTKELQAKLHDFEKLSDDIRKKVDDLFANIMTQRLELINCFRL